ncbi:hypothetical protein GCM10027291_52100 [Telluribacter humicola]
MLLVLIGLVFSACEGPQGEIGPEGPQGPQGVQGEPGEAGTAGAFQFSTDTISTDESGDLAFALEDLPADAVASVEKGVILVYAKSQNLWFPLPGIVLFGNNQVSSYSFFYGIEGQNMNVFLLQNSEAAKRSFQDLRVVIVPALNARLSAEVNLKNYEDVRKAFNLPE